MSTPIKIILYIILGLLLINVAANFLDRSAIRDLRKDLRAAKASADSALAELRTAKSRLDSIRSDLITFRSNVNNVQVKVALEDAQKKLADEKNSKRRKELEEWIEELKKMLNANPLPDIGEGPAKKQ